MAKKNRRSSSKIMEKHPGGGRSIKTKTRKRTATIIQKKKENRSISSGELETLKQLEQYLGKK